VKVRLYFKVTQLHRLEVDTADYKFAPQGDAEDFAEWLESRAGYGATQDFLDRIDNVRSWVDTEDEVEITEVQVVEP